MYVIEKGEERVKAYKCSGCDGIFEEQALLNEPIYECGGCGEIFTRSNSADGDSHHCPSCGKFGSKVAEYAFPHCEDDSELTKVEAYECDLCGELHETGTDWVH